MAFSGIPNKGEQKQKCSPTKGNKIRSGYLTPTFSGAQKRAEVLRHPHVPRVHYRRGGKQKWPAPGSRKKSGQSSTHLLPITSTNSKSLQIFQLSSSMYIFGIPFSLLQCSFLSASMLATSNVCWVPSMLPP